MGLINKRRSKQIVLLLYAVLLGITALHHEPWFDEAQAWLLARDSSLIELLVTNLRYEGSPGLWHLLLWIPAKLHFPYFTLTILSVFLALMGVYLFLWYSPFPVAIKVLYPFSFFSFYQYAVVARSYALLPPLLFSIAILYPKRRERTYLYVILLCLLANVSLHGLIIAGGMAFTRLLEDVKEWRPMHPLLKRRQLNALGVFGIMSLLLFLQLKPAPDLISFAAFHYDYSGFLSRSLVMACDALSTNLSTGEAGGWLSSVSYLLAAATILFTFIWLFSRKKLLLFIVPFTGLCFLFTAVYSNVWHQGTLFYTWLFTLWVSFEKRGRYTPEFSTMPAGKAVKGFLSFLIMLVLTVQVHWSLNSFRYDLNYSYSASREIARYLKENCMENKKIYMTSFHTISILPYFHDNIFCNYNQKSKPAFWLWSEKNTMYSEPYLHLSGYNPEIIIIGVKEYSGRPGLEEAVLHRDQLPDIPGYVFSKGFQGGLYWKDGLFETDSFALYEKIHD